MIASNPDPEPGKADKAIICCLDELEQTNVPDDLWSMVLNYGQRIYHRAYINCLEETLERIDRKIAE